MMTFPREPLRTRSHRTSSNRSMICAALHDGSTAVSMLVRPRWRTRRPVRSIRHVFFGHRSELPLGDGAPNVQRRMPEAP